MRNSRRGVLEVGRILVLICVMAAPAGLCYGDVWGLSFMPPNGMAEPGTEDNYNKVFRFDNDGNKLVDDVASGSGG